MKKVIFKAKLGVDAPVQIVGSYEFSDEEWAEELADFDGDEQDWLQNRGADWAYEAARSDCLREWAELVNET